MLINGSPRNMFKPVAIIISAFILVQSATSHAQEDPRLVNDWQRNVLVTNLVQALHKAFPNGKLGRTDLNPPHRVGSDTYVVSFSQALGGIEKPPVEKDLEGLNEFFQPFIKSQKQAYEQRGFAHIIQGNGFMLAKYAKDYTKDYLPTIHYGLFQLQEGINVLTNRVFPSQPLATSLLDMKVAFIERHDNYLVVDFTIVARE